jgi:hypothetical protein
MIFRLGVGFVHGDFAFRGDAGPSVMKIFLKFFNGLRESDRGLAEVTRRYLNGATISRPARMRRCGHVDIASATSSPVSCRWAQDVAFSSIIHRSSMN